MPCTSGYLAPTERETYLRHTAQLLRWALLQAGMPVPPWVMYQASHQYAEDKGQVQAMCELLTSIGEKGRDKLIYQQSRVPEARNLADWWERHEAADRVRIAKEKAEQDALQLAAQAEGKLTPKELKALKKKWDVL